MRWGLVTAGYTHDAQCVVYSGPDATYKGREVCFNYNEDTLTIVDVSDKCVRPAITCVLSFCGAPPAAAHRWPTWST
jgi:hypothetical protein